MAYHDELCIQYEMLLALLDNGLIEPAKEILKNAIKRIDRGYTSSSTDNSDNGNKAEN